MSATACACGADEPCTVACSKHGDTLHGYPCGACMKEWEQANPRTAEAVARFANGRGSLQAINRARTEDREDS